MNKKLCIILISLSMSVSCAKKFAAHEYPHSSILGYNPADTTNLEELYYMDKKGNVSLMPKSANAPSSRAALLIFLFFISKLNDDSKSDGLLSGKKNHADRRLLNVNFCISLPVIFTVPVVLFCGSF